MTTKTADSAKPLVSPTFAQLCTAYPRLGELAAEAASHEAEGHRRTFCANSIWYDRPQWGRSLRDRVIAVADRAVTRYGQRAYDVVYEGVYNQLPDCGECGCFSREVISQEDDI